MSLLRVGQASSAFRLSGDSEDGRIFTVDINRRVRLACAKAMSERGNSSSGARVPAR
jgi:hypothetical protein